MELDTFNRKIVPMRMRLIGRARQLTGDDDSAEDLVQEVMLKLWVKVRLDWRNRAGDLRALGYED